MDGSLSDDEICDVIKNYKERINHVQNEINISYAALASFRDGTCQDDLIMAASIPGENGKRQNDLSDVIDEYQHLVRDETDEIRAYVYELKEMRERMNSIMRAFYRLSVQDQTAFRKIVCKGKPATVAYEEAAVEMDRSLATVMRMRRDLIEKIRKNWRKQ